MHLPIYAPSAETYTHGHQRLVVGLPLADQISNRQGTATPVQYSF
jgi:hypothetical protein